MSGTITLQYPLLPDDTTAYGTQVVANDQSIVSKVNGGLDDDNLANSGITASSKLKDGTVSASKIASQSIRQAAMDFRFVSLGCLIWQCGPSYPGNNGARMIRVSKTITIASATTEQTFSVDWSAGDSPDGHTTFTAIPTLTGMSILDAGGAIDDTMQYAKFTGITTIGADIAIKFSSAPTGGDVTVSFFAGGAI